MIRVAAIGDVHCWEGADGHFKPLFSKINSEADVFLLAGDLTMAGKVEEAEVLMRELEVVKVPMVAVVGNHDCDEGKDNEIADLLRRREIPVLEGNSVVFQVDGKTVGIAGTKGFCGGFDKYAVAPYGEQALKDFVHASLTEAYKLEEALSPLDADYRVVLLHYAPIRDTVVGEALELWPFLGSSALIKPVERFGANVVFHAHAHYGSPRGTSKNGVPVFNVARTVMKGYFVFNLD
ncbi:MAG: metallophosphoesterase [Chloroflexi bacterium]|nr:metallophosphoesterase [Chloroflexota bacterium]